MNYIVHDIADVFLKESNDRIYYLGVTNMDLLDKKATHSKIRAGIGNNIINRRTNDIFDFEVNFFDALYDKLLEKEENYITLEDGTNCKVKGEFDIKNTKHKFDVTIITKQYMYYSDREGVRGYYYKIFKSSIISIQDNITRVQNAYNTIDYNILK